MRSILLAALLVLAPACAMARFTDNEPLPPERLQQLHPGKADDTAGAPAGS